MPNRNHGYIDGAPITFSTVLRPHQSVTLSELNLIVGLVGAVWIGIGLVFASLGAWPVSTFIGADVILLYGALLIHYRRSMAREVIELTEKALTISRINRSGRGQSWTMQPEWLQIIDGQSEYSRGYGRRCIELRSHGRSLTVGSFLSGDERRRLINDLRQAIHRHARPRTSSRE